jgi:hypothetical protein
MPDLYISPATTATIAVGGVISVFYLRYAWLALRRSAVTLTEPDDQKNDRFAYSFGGAIFAVIASSLAIASYGFSPLFLYVGIVLALASPVAVAYTLYSELRE